LPINALQCPHCAANVPSPSAGAASNSSAEQVWTINDGGRQFGPHSQIELASLAASGQITPNALAWKPGMAQWLPISAVIPITSAAPSNNPVYAYDRPPSNSGLTVPILIAGIFHLLWGVPLMHVPCVGWIVGIPMIILGIFELRLFVNSSRLPPAQLIKSARTLAIFEILCIIGFNLPSLVCGIIVLSNLPRYPAATQRF
jgi:hypothetical protein